MPQSKDTLSSPDVAYAAEQARAWYTLADAIVSPLKLGAGQDGYMKSWEVLKELVYDPRKQGALVPGDVLHSLLFGGERWSEYKGSEVQKEKPAPLLEMGLGIADAVTYEFAGARRPLQLAVYPTHHYLNAQMNKRLQIVPEYTRHNGIGVARLAHSPKHFSNVYEHGGATLRMGDMKDSNTLERLFSGSQFHFGGLNPNLSVSARYSQLGYSQRYFYDAIARLESESGLFPLLPAIVGRQESLYANDSFHKLFTTFRAELARTLLPVAIDLGTAFPTASQGAYGEIYEATATFFVGEWLAAGKESARELWYLSSKHPLGVASQVARDESARAGYDAQKYRAYRVMVGDRVVCEADAVQRFGPRTDGVPSMDRTNFEHMTGRDLSFFLAREARKSLNLSVKSISALAAKFADAMIATEGVRIPPGPEREQFATMVKIVAATWPLKLAQIGEYVIAGPARAYGA